MDLKWAKPHWPTTARGRLMTAIVTSSLFAGVLVAASPPLRAQAAWAAQTSGTSNALYGVTCTDTSYCWAVGASGTIVATTNSGATWTVQTSGTSNQLNGVTCVSSSKCWTVGAGGTVLTTANGGSTWTAQTSGTTNILYAVACPTASICIAVGASGTVLTTGNGGSTWALQSLPSNDLDAISCPSTTSCWAADTGGYVHATTNDGSTWSTQDPGLYTTLTGISCPTTSFCWVVGSNASIIGATSNGGSSWSTELWDNSGSGFFGISCASTLICTIVGRSGGVEATADGGSTWTSQNAGTSNNLQAVACVNPSACWAVGAGGTILVTPTSQKWSIWPSANNGYWSIPTSDNAASWSTSTPLDGSSTKNNYLRDVYCTNSVSCVAAGYQDVKSGGNTYQQTLIETWSPWTIQTTANTASNQNNYLYGIGCEQPSSTYCIAVGHYNNGTYDQTLIEHSNLSVAWAIDTSYNTSTTQNNDLQSVSCGQNGANHAQWICMAVGYYNNGTYAQTLTEEYNGSSWSVVSSQNSSTTQNNYLYGVSCSSDTYCVATGFYNNGSYNQTLTEVWTGTTWTIVSSLNTSTTQNNYLEAVGCTAQTTSCMAAGYYNNGTYNQTLIEQWNGTTWSTVASPNTSNTQNNFLYGVKCPSTSTCQAVGSYNTGTYDQALAEEWDGTSWSVVPTTDSSATQNNDLYGVSCDGYSGLCIAVGSYLPGSYRQTWAEQWNKAATNNYLRAVSCTSTTFCMADGYYNNGSVNQTLTEEWNGTAWSVVNSPNSSSTDNDYLEDISCTSSSFCMATGFSNNGSYNQTLVQEWNGSSWSIITSANTSATQNNDLWGMSCTSANFCIASGYYNNGTHNQTLIESWNGSTWSIATSPNTSTAQDNNLMNVSCVTANFCTGSGYYNSGTYQQTLIEQWDGSSWSIATSPNSSTSQNNYLEGVSCTSTSFCMVSGYYHGATYDQNLIEEWNGSSWAITTSPDTSTTQNNDIDAVSCTSATFCMTTGYYNTGTYQQTLAEEWNGTSWSITTSNNSSSSQNNSLFAPSCISTAFCMSVGQYNTGTYSQALVAEWNTVGVNNQLYGISCTSSSFCMAIGYYNNGTSYTQTLMEEWNGSSWSITNSPSSASASDSLQAVSCYSTTFCMAVGYYPSASYEQTFVEKWDGSAWTIITSPDTSTTQNNYLEGVSCTSASACMAAGYSTASYDQTLIEQWNGSSWSILTSADTSSTQNNFLEGISCNSGFCMATGYYLNASSWDQTLAETWNGSSWAIVTSANSSATQNNFLEGVSCTSASFCMSSGYYSGTADQTLIEEWTGTAFSIVTSPNVYTGQSNDLYGVSCASISFCMAVGNYIWSYDATLIEQWNGSAWSVDQSQNTSSSQSNVLRSVSCSSSSFCGAAGYYQIQSPSAYQTLIEQWSSNAVAVTAVSPTMSCSSTPSITVTGSGFTGATEVDFGKVAQTSFTVNSDNQITVNAPSSSLPQTVDVVVTSPYGSSIVSRPADQFTYRVHPSPGTRLRGGKSFSSGTQQALDTCFP